MTKSELEETFELHLKVSGLPEPKREYKFHPKRKWRFDFAWEEYKVGVEIEGGTWIFGRHNRGDGFENDVEKYNAAALLGWTVLRFTASGVNSLYAIETTKQALIAKMKESFLFIPEVTQKANNLEEQKG